MLTPPYKILFVGRPNVGKSSLFNALLGKRRSIVFDEPGTTRDRLSEVPTWAEKNFELVDGPGIYSEKDGPLLNRLLDEVDACVFVVDALAGLTPFDSWLAGEVRKRECPVLLCINKSENVEGAIALGEFSPLKFEEWATVSAAHRRNLDAIKRWCHLVSPTELQKDEPAVRLSFLGRPNVGKSTLMNYLAGSEVSLVSPVAHTTRDVVRHVVEHKGRRFELRDTAGIRRQHKSNDIETFSVHAAKRSLRESDAIFLLLNVSEPLSEQDKRLISLVEEAGKPALILLNFWDKMTAEAIGEFESVTKQHPIFQKFASLPICAASGWNLGGLLDEAREIADRSGTRIPTAKLNSLVRMLIAQNPPPASGTGNFNVLYSSQVSTKPPTFVFFMNRKKAFPQTYAKYLQNGLQKQLGLQGQPIRLLFRGDDKPNPFATRSRKPNSNRSKRSRPHAN